MTRICCPACGFSKDIPAERLPADLSRIKCPKCRKVFAHESHGEKRSQPRSGASRALLVACPHCQDKKRVAADRIPPGRHQLRCWQCGEKFEYLQNQPLPAVEDDAEEGASGSLPPVIDLFSRSWQLYRRRVWTLLGIYLLTILVPVFLVGVLAVVAVPLCAAGGGEPGIGAGLLGFLLVLLIAGLITWGMVGMIVASVDATVGIRQALKLSWKRFWAFGWMFFLLSFIVTGGFFLLMVPALVFMTWFVFAQYILIDEDERGMSALLKSREYVRGYFWEVLLRLLVLWATVFFLTLLLGWIPWVGTLFQLLLFPFTLLHQFLLFDDIRRVRGERLKFFCSTRQKLAWLGVAALGFLVLPVALWLADAPAQFNRHLPDWQLQSRGINLQQPANWNQSAEQAEEQFGQEPAVPEPITREEYNTLLGQAQVGFAEGGLSLGPAALKLDQFWDGSPPHLWLRFRVAAVPNLKLAGDAAVKVRIDQVLGDGGSNQYDATNMLEKDFFQQVALSPAAKGGYEGYRDVHLRPGTSAGEISRINGVLELRLPLGIKTLSLTPSHLGEEYSLAGHVFTFKGMQHGVVELEFPDGIEPLLQLVGYNADGRPLAEAGSSWSELDGVTTLNGNFQGELFTLKVIMAGEFAHEEYPFELSSDE